MNEQKYEGLFQPVEFQYGEKLILNPNMTKKSNGSQEHLTTIEEQEKNIEQSQQQDSPLSYQLKIHWKNQPKVGSGILNHGNTCFMNAVLQSLTYLSIFGNFLMDQIHSSSCRAQKDPTRSICTLCAFQDHVILAFSPDVSIISPTIFMQNIDMFFLNYRVGKQEDAHQFLILLLESFLKKTIDASQDLFQFSVELSPIFRIFGGKLVTIEQCSFCYVKERQYEQIFDISIVQKIDHY